jgi:hypothetical protein
MGISQIVSAVAVLVTGLLPSCSKLSAQHKAPATSVTAANGTNAVHNFGELTLTNHYETCVHLAGGKFFTLTPKMIDSRDVQLTLSLESKTAAGKIHDLSVTQVVTESGKPLEFAVGDFQFSMTPNITSE